MKPIKLEKAALAAAAKECSSIEAYEKSTNQPTWLRWFCFYTAAKEAKLHPADTQEQLTHEASEFRKAHKLKHSPRSMRSVMAAVWGENSLPTPRAPRTKKASQTASDPLSVCKEAIRGTKAGIKRCESSITALNADLTKYQKDLKSLEKMEKALSED